MNYMQVAGLDHHSSDDGLLQYDCPASPASSCLGHLVHCKQDLKSMQGFSDSGPALGLKLTPGPHHCVPSSDFTQQDTRALLRTSGHRVSHVAVEGEGSARVQYARIACCHKVVFESVYLGVLQLNFSTGVPLSWAIFGVRVYPGLGEI